MGGRKEELELLKTYTLDDGDDLVAIIVLAQLHLRLPATKSMLWKQKLLGMNEQNGCCS
jgi:hypothetical protein